jgi:hypothetical protein
MVISRLKGLVARFRFPSLLREDFGVESKQPVENTDALAAAGMRRADPSGFVGNSIPPNYVPPADEGRPRH